MGDSLHQKPGILVLKGSLIEGVLEVVADYGGGWRWMISVDGRREDRLDLTMHNVIPDEHATDDEPAGPYPVTVSASQRLGLTEEEMERRGRAAWSGWRSTEG